MRQTDFATSQITNENPSEARRADLSPFQGDQRGCRPWGQREARGIDTGICTKKGHRRESMTFFRGDSRIRTGDPLLAKQVLYQLSYTPEVVPGRR